MVEFFLINWAVLQIFQNSFFFSNTSRWMALIYPKVSLYLIEFVSKFRFEVDLCELINFYSPWNHDKTIGFVMTSRETELDTN